MAKHKFKKDFDYANPNRSIVAYKKGESYELSDAVEKAAREKDALVGGKPASTPTPTPTSSGNK